MIDNIFVNIHSNVHILAPKAKFKWSIKIKTSYYIDFSCLGRGAIRFAGLYNLGVVIFLLIKNFTFW